MAGGRLHLVEEQAGAEAAQVERRDELRRRMRQQRSGARVDERARLANGALPLRTRRQLARAKQRGRPILCESDALASEHVFLKCSAQRLRRLRRLFLDSGARRLRLFAASGGLRLLRRRRQDVQLVARVDGVGDSGLLHLCRLASQPLQQRRYRHIAADRAD
eukprot:6202239-Pleurochrysis_carterae.AAC.2